MSADTADTEPKRPEREAHVRPEDVKKIGGAQSVDDKVETWQRQIEAGEHQDSSLRGRLLWYGALFVALLLGSLMSGFSLSGGGGGGGVFFGALVAELLV